MKCRTLFVRLHLLQQQRDARQMVKLVDARLSTPPSPNLMASAHSFGAGMDQRDNYQHVNIVSQQRRQRQTVQQLPHRHTLKHRHQQDNIH